MRKVIALLTRDAEEVSLLPHKYKHKAYLFDRRLNVLSEGWNSPTKSHPQMWRGAVRVGLPHKIYLHAEIDALIQVPKHQQVYYAAVMRVGKDGEFRNSKPCVICEAALRLAGIREVWYTTELELMCEHYRS